MHTATFDMGIAIGDRYWPVSYFWLVLKVWLGILIEFLGSFYTDHVRFDLCHPYGASTNALITEVESTEGREETQTPKVHKWLEDSSLRHSRVSQACMYSYQPQDI